MRAQLIAEFLGTLFLSMIVIGSGIMGENLAGGNEAIALLVNSLATGAGLFVLIQCLGSISGAHLNPVVTLVEAISGRLNKSKLLSNWVVQFLGAIVGVLIANYMFGLDVLQVSTKVRSGTNLWISEVIATFGLICTIGLAGKKHGEFAPLTIALYITSAYWFTSSTSFANPAITVARIFTNTFGGMAPEGMIYYIMAQIIGAIIGMKLVKAILKFDS